MKHYFNPINEQIFAYEEDGSQDHLIDSSFVPIEGQALIDLRAKKDAALIAQSIAETNNMTPDQKLAQFLSANPDVLKLITLQS